MTWWSNARIELEFGVLVFVEGEKLENPEKIPLAGTRTNNKLNPHVTPGPGIEPGPQPWEASALTTAPCQINESFRVVISFSITQLVD